MGFFFGDGGDNVLTGGVEVDDIRGFDGNDLLEGGDSTDIIQGGNGNDTVSGQGGDDDLFGNDGNDRLNGGAGADSLDGGAGNDIYNFVDAMDNLFETPDNGYDTVRTAESSFSLATIFGGNTNLNNFEQLVLLHAGATTGTGNHLDNLIYSFGGDDILSGLGGDDAIHGGIGQDTIHGGTGADRLFGQAGDDILNGGDNGDVLEGAQGNDALNGDGGDDDLYGMIGRDALNGGDGNDYLVGGAQRDVLTGGAGRDIFLFAAGDFAGFGRASADSITDFSRTEGDVILLDGVAITSFIGEAAFSGTAGELRYANFQGDTMIYGDTNGDGAADFALHLVGTIELVVGDFIFGV